MNVYNDDRQILGLDQLQAQLREIHQKSVQPKVECVNIVSSDARDCWAEVYERLKRSFIFISLPNLNSFYFKGTT
jgi:hypothetical protein